MLYLWYILRLLSFVVCSCAINLSFVNEICFSCFVYHLISAFVCRNVNLVAFVYSDIAKDKVKLFVVLFLWYILFCAV